MMTMMMMATMTTTTTTMMMVMVKAGEARGGIRVKGKSLCKRLSGVLSV